MLGKVNVTGIVLDHLGTLRDHSTCKYHRADFLLFFGVPAVVTGVLLYSYGDLKPNLVTIVATSLSVFAALLFNLLLLVYDAVRKSESVAAAHDDLREEFLRQVASNISFAILVAVATIVSVLALVFVNRVSSVAHIVSGIIYFLVTLFLLTLLMVLKRVHALLSEEIGHD